RSNCDAETIIHAYEEWGDDCVLRFRGILAFAIWDQRSRRLFCARDHLGVKPFYYKSSKTGLSFASQPKALASDFRVDPQAFADYLFYGIVPHDRGVFEAVHKLPPGHRLVYDHGALSVEKYWEVAYRPEIKDADEAAAELTSVLENSVTMQLMSDVPYGTYLSGGIDSSLITAIAAEKSDVVIPTITVGFNEKKRDERPFARIVADHCKTRHHEAILDYRSAMNLVGELADVYDEPYALGASLPMVFVAKETQRNDLKVVLAGDGADELFAGYRHYDRMAEGGEYRPHESMIQTREELLMAGDAISADWNPGWRFREFFPILDDPVAAARVLDANTYLPDEILSKVDRATMAASVEARVPFLDPQLVELAFQIDNKVMYQAGERKALLKNVARKWLPDEVLTQRKKGFSIPFLRWMMRPMNWLKMYRTVNGGMLTELQLIDGDAFKRRGAFLPAVWLWKFYVAELWARRWL
ncbi:MAG: asparagine synthase (glutamine-hydrolyzing), partial [Verrucomicrobiota bacterium]